MALTVLATTGADHLVERGPGLTRYRLTVLILNRWGSVCVDRDCDGLPHALIANATGSLVLRLRRGCGRWSLCACTVCEWKVPTDGVPAWQ